MGEESQQDGTPRWLKIALLIAMFGFTVPAFFSLIMLPMRVWRAVGAEQESAPYALAWFACLALAIGGTFQVHRIIWRKVMARRDEVLEPPAG